MSIYKKIRKANLLRKTAFEAAQAGAQGTGIDFDKKDDNGPNKVANPITYKSSPTKQTDPNVEKKIVNYKGTAHDYIRTNVNKPDTYNTKSIDAAKGGGTLETDQNKYFKGLYERFGDDVTTQELIDKKFISAGAGDAYSAFTGGKNKGVLTPGKSSANVTLTPRKEEIKTDPTQTFNMDFRNSENANWAEGAQRRGTRRAERRANRDIRRYEEGSKGFLGLGKGKGKGELSANVIAAGEKTGKTIKGLNYDAEGNITGDKDQKVTEQMRSRATNLSMNKYNQGLNEFNYKPGSSTTSPESGEGYEVYDGPVGDIDTNTTVFSDFMKSSPTFNGMGLGLFPKSKLGKNASAFKNKSGRGAGY